LGKRLLSADMSEVPVIVDDIQPRRGWVDPTIARKLNTETDAKAKLKLSLALARRTPAKSNSSPSSYPGCAQDFAVIRTILLQYKEKLIAPSGRNSPAGTATATGRSRGLRFG